MGSSGESRWMPNPPWAGDSGREVGNTVRASPEGLGPPEVELWQGAALPILRLHVPQCGVAVLAGLLVAFQHVGKPPEPFFLPVLS